MTDLDDIEFNKKAFNQYMMAALQRSSDYSQDMLRQSYNAIQLLFTILSALAGGLILTLTTVTDVYLFHSIAGLIFLFASGFGTLTYVWLVTLIFQQRKESLIRFFLEKYFHDLNPNDYQKYGLSKLFVPYRRYIDESIFSPGKITSLSLISLAIFSSLMLSISSSFGLLLLLITKNNMIQMSILSGLILFVILIVVDRTHQKALKRDYDLANEIFLTYHQINRVNESEADVKHPSKEV
jgi:hypothetical protein